MGNIVTNQTHFAQHAAGQNAEMQRSAAVFSAKQTSEKAEIQALDLPLPKARGWGIYEPTNKAAGRSEAWGAWRA